MNLSEGTRRLTLLLGVVGAILGGCRGANLPHSPAQDRRESRTQTYRQPCVVRLPAKLTEDAATLREVRKRGVLPDIQNMTPRNATIATKAQGATLALMAFFGDPREPSIPSMADFPNLADDLHAQKALGEAFAAIDQKDDAGVAKAESTMSETEKQYFSTAQSAMATIEDRDGKAARLDVPLIGTVTTPDSRSYLNLMLGESERLRVSLNGMPDNRRALWWLEYRTGQVIDKLNVGCTK